MKNITKIVVCLLLVLSSFGAGLGWGQVIQFNKMSVPVMGVMK